MKPKTKLRISSSHLDGCICSINAYFFSSTYNIVDGKVMKGETESKTLFYKLKNGRHQIHETI